MDSGNSAAQSIPSFRRPRIVLIGVGHVFDIKAAVKDLIHQINPQTVALELDPARFYGLLSRQRGGKESLPLVYRLMARFQQDLAQQYGSEAGSEMLAAAEAAQEIAARVALIDMDAAKVFMRMNKAMSMREKTLMAIGAVLSLFTRKATVERELDRFMSNEEKFMQEIQKEYPSVVRVLIDERNEFMAQKLREISAQSGVTVAVIGDGHVSGMTKLLSDFAEVEVRRLHDLQNPAAVGENSQMSFSFEVRPPDGKT